ncbi:hypothetical protein B0I03_108109 [Flavobacterium aquaticum]|uniref:Uncharacterized protein n=1 Tax=Flavobacterium aquaticum TaxID=1236486 RepID=A0A327YH35_9FLAO|nr:hypothetical protein [Flavobacterium aquaticum]RAK20214.1 hypothetical protein B0I03_108109 [Flavobacterium aquaticum]
MKIKIIVFLLISVVGFSQKKKINQEYDYINNYYQFVYQAHYEYLNKNYQKAYDLLKTAEKNCPLLNQTGIYEPRILAECATFLNKPKEAVHYLEILVKDYGYSYNSIKNDSIFLNIQRIKSWKKLERNNEKYAKNYLEKVDFNLRKELHQMKIDDQSVRTNGYDEQKAKVIDSINQLKLYRIVVDYDFFPEYSFNQVGNYNIDNYDPEISVLVMHIRSNKADFWKPILLDLIRRGRAPARLYGNLSDSILRSNGVYDYGIYQNIGKELINDYENLDKRRIAVGLPTLAYQNFVYEYWQKEFEKYKEQNGN